MQKSEKNKDCIKGAITKIYKNYDPSRLITTDHVFVIMNLGGKLLDIGGKNEIYAGLVDNWKVSEDQKVFTFHLSYKAKFSDGSPVKMKDVEASIKRHLIYPGTHIEFKDKILGGNINSFNDKVDGLKIINDESFQITLKYADQNFLYWLAFPEITIVPYDEALKSIDQMTFKVTSGPYYLEKNDENHLVFKKNPFFYFSHGSAAQCVHVYGYENPENVVTDLLKGKLDFIDYGAMLTPSFSKVVTNDQFNIVKAEEKSSVYFTINTEKSHLKDPQIRAWLRNKISSGNLIPYENGGIFHKHNQFLVETQQGFLSDSEVNEVNTSLKLKQPSNLEKLTVLYPEVFGDKFKGFLIKQLEYMTGLKIDILSYAEGESTKFLNDKKWDLYFILVGMGEKDTSILYSYHFKGSNPFYPWSDIIIKQTLDDITKTNNIEEKLKLYKIVSKRLLEMSYIIPIATFNWPVITKSNLAFERTNQFLWGNPVWTLNWKN